MKLTDLDLVLSLGPADDFFVVDVNA